MTRLSAAFRFFIKIATGAIDGDLAKDKPQSMPVFPTPLHILVVEDNVVNQKVLCRQLAKAKLTYDGASFALTLPLRSIGDIGSGLGV